MNPTQFFKCLADETRLHSILLLTTEDELCVCELVEALELSQPKISRHLAQLRSCGLLLDRRHEQWVFYQINPQLPTWIKETLALVARAEQKTLLALHKKLKRVSCNTARS